MDDTRDVVDDYTDQSLSRIHHVLRASRRRLTVGLISHRCFNRPEGRDEGHRLGTRREPEVSVRQVAKEIAAIEEDTSTENATGDAYRNVYTALIQTHLPELDEVGAVEYDDDRKTVRPGRNLPALAIVTAVSSPLAQMLFHDAVARSSSSELSPDDDVL